MAKRFTDNEKWKKSFFKSLSTVDKLFFLYILDECDHAGIWHVEPDIAALRIGNEIDIEKSKNEFGKHIYEFDSGEKWFIPFFVEFQYGLLNNNVNAHKSVINKLKKYKLLQKYKQLINSSSTDMDKDKDKDKKEDNDFDRFWKLYDKKVSKQKTILIWNKLTNAEKDAIFDHIPQYKLSQPDKIYRKNPDVYLRNRGWEDEIIISGNAPKLKKKYIASEYKCEVCGKPYKFKKEGNYKCNNPECEGYSDMHGNNKRAATLTFVKNIYEN